MTGLDVGPDWEPRPQGNITPKSWGEVTVGHVVRDQNDQLWTVLRDEQGWVLLERHTGERRSMRKPDAARTAWVYVPSDEEALLCLEQYLGARVLRDIEARERTLAKIPHFRYDPVPRDVVSLKDHLSWMHAVELQDQLNAWNRVKKRQASKKSERAEKKAELAAILQEMCDAHDEFHEHPATWPMSLPHHHATEAPS